jgi:lysozyme family protein
MGIYTQAFELAVNHAMLYEVGGFWNVNVAGVADGTNSRACGYTNDPNDPGGETKFGIAKSANPTLDITHLTWDQAKAVYYSHYWLNTKCDKMNGRVAALVFDSAVNNGSGTAAKFLQRAIGVTDDGAIGPGTLATLTLKDPIMVCNSVCDQRISYYNSIVANKPSQSVYLAGWLRRVSEMRAFVTNPNTQF